MSEQAQLPRQQYFAAVAPHEHGVHARVANCLERFRYDHDSFSLEKKGRLVVITCRILCPEKEFIQLVADLQKIPGIKTVDLRQDPAGINTLLCQFGGESETLLCSAAA
jgi:hypothetical protein